MLYIVLELLLGFFYMDVVFLSCLTDTTLTGLNVPIECVKQSMQQLSNHSFFFLV